MGYFTKKPDKKSGDGLALTEWNDLCNAVAGNAGLTLSLSNDDKMGIGTNNPSHKIHIKTHDAVGLFESTGSQAYLRFSTNEGFDKRVEFCNRPGGRAAIWVSGGNDALNVLANGNVGIQTTNPTEKLEVSGKVKASHFIGDGSQLTNLTVGALGLNLATSPGAKVGIGTTSPQAPLSIGAAEGKEENPDQSMHITNDCILFGGANSGLEANSGQISIGKHRPNSLNIIGVSTGKNSATRKVDIWAEGGLQVMGPLSASRFVGIKLELGPVQTTDWINNFDQVMDFVLPDGHVMVGLYSVHDNNKEDRRFRIKFRSLTLAGV